ncbi:hypothetical protein H2200_000372 [Cladophialophora chaetospira]|uniref:Uncharacterized protein n=1 Tax=Cladophialophora chaetospira TaxID=386627 RepID=A0AA38XNB3_9EURO|nr:hypothetical protein H2200_000372 [Cladophialophora chaetospira]
MSTIRYFDSIPHIVRYGRQDEEKGESWTLFYRNATCFRVSVSRDDVDGTPFGTRWLELNREGSPREEGMKKWVERWNKLCDCIISQCMPLLQELAPTTRQWKTLEDHLRTPTYELKLVANPNGNDAVAKVTSGPVEKPSYEHHLLNESDFQSLPKDLPRHRAQDLTILEHGKDGRHPPDKIHAPNGEVLYFLPCHKRSKNVSTGEIWDASVNKINAYSRIHSGSEYLDRIYIPKLQGVVVTSADGEVEDWDVQGNLSPDMGQSATKEPGEPLVAGVLLTYVSKAKYLRDVMKVATDPVEIGGFATVKENWKAQLTSAVRYLHDRGIAMGGRTDPNSTWSYINQYTVQIAPVKTTEGSTELDMTSLEGAQAWLMIDATCTLLDPEDPQEQKEKFEEQKNLDWEAVEKLFT